MSETNIASQTLPFAGRAAIVTGAASGIGLATVELLHRQGARIVAVGRGDNVNALAREGVVPVVADVAQEASAELAVQTAIGQFGRLDILVNNAGIIINRPVAEMSLEEWNQVLSVNATGAFLFSRAAMRPMMAAGSGAIVNIGSYACYQSFPGIAAYAASGALAQLTRTLALEAISHGIRVNAVGSGDAVTNITNAIQPDGQAYLAEHGRRRPSAARASGGNRASRSLPGFGPGQLHRRRGGHGRRRHERSHPVIHPLSNLTGVSSMQQQAHSSKVWFITGAARGIGLSLARQALAQGNAVAATSRTLASLQQAFGDKHERLLPLEVDLVDEASVQAAIDRTVATFGRIDCVVNNAGYGQQGTIEALSDAELRRNFDVNVFAPLHVLRHALRTCAHSAAACSTWPPSSASRAGMRAGAATWPASSRWPG